MKQNIQQIIHNHGFELFGIVPATEAHTSDALESWLQSGMHGSMEWMARDDAIRKRQDPRNILSGTQSIITLAYRYTPLEIPQTFLDDPSRGIIARYALYDDYHTVVKKKLKRLVRSLCEEFGQNIDWKAYVDTGPILEREWAQRAGLGFIGRNSNLIHHQFGSYFFLSEILLDMQLPEVRSEARGSCANCRACMTDCPTNAIVADGVVDARKCISYMTIEHRGDIPEWIRPLMKNRIYGCDICQEVCPWNGTEKARDAIEKSDFQVREDLVAPPLEDLRIFDDEEFRERFAKSPIRRAKRDGFMRNVAIALGNWGVSDARALLVDIRRIEQSALVLSHVDWALTQCDAGRKASA